MRSIKFRAWDKKQNRMVFWLWGDFTWKPIDGSQPFPWPQCYGLDISDPMQFTGLLDKNGVEELFEGDIIGLDGKKKGNKYETPSLLKEKSNFIIEGMGTQAWRNSEQEAMERGCFYPK